MKRKYPRVSIRLICALFGKQRQPYYDKQGTFQRKQLESALVLSWVREIRKDLPKLGVHKLYSILKSRIAGHQIKMGRDKFWHLLRYHKLLAPRRKWEGIPTTNSFHNFWKWPNLIQNFTPTKAGQLWVTDISYIRLKEDGFAYMALVTDAYSRKIIGHTLNPNLHTNGPIKALDMALNERRNKCEKLIHHSDRGIQYCSSAYTEILKREGIRISMTKGGAPTQNAIAERVNGILKTEFGLRETFTNIYEAERAVASAVFRYNYLRPHASCDYNTPAKAHQLTGNLRKRWYNAQQGKPR